MLLQANKNWIYQIWPKFTQTKVPYTDEICSEKLSDLKLVLNQKKTWPQKKYLKECNWKVY